MPDLFPYQKTGAEWLSQRTRALLADEMGLGKTAQAIVGSDIANARRIIVLCPAVARHNWQREYDRFSIFGRPTRRIEKKTDSVCPDGVTVCSYDLASDPRIFRELRDLKADVLVADESHFLKSPDAQRTKTVLGKEGLVHHTARQWLLSGTPSPNNYAELWVPLYVMGAYKGGYDSFVRRYCTGYHDGYRFKITGGQRVEELRALLKTIMLRRNKVDVMPDLPPLFFSDYVVPPGEIDTETHFWRKWRDDAARDTELEKMEQAVRTVIRHAKGDRAFEGLKSIGDSVSTWRKWTGLAKTPAYCDLVTNDLESGLEKIVIFAVHRCVIQELQLRLRQYNPQTVYGGTPADKRQRAIDRFVRKGKHRIFIGQIIAAGTAIDLTVAHHVDFLEADWVPGNNAQAVMRCHRFGQDKPVNARFISLAGSLDEHLMKSYRRKAEQLSVLYD